MMSRMERWRWWGVVAALAGFVIYSWLSEPKPYTDVQAEWSVDGA